MRFARMEKASDGFPRISRKDDDHDDEDEGEIPLNGYQPWALLPLRLRGDHPGLDNPSQQILITPILHHSIPPTPATPEFL
jgi:hypothetical protein